MEKWHFSKGLRKTNAICYSAIKGYGIEKVAHVTTRKQTGKHVTIGNRLVELTVYGIFCVCDGLSQLT